jgi:hypothetical protein
MLAVQIQGEQKVSVHLMFAVQVTPKYILALRQPNYIPFVIRVILVAGKVFTHNSDTGKRSILIQCWNIVQQIERDGVQRYQT